MGRRSALTPEQWEAAARMIGAGKSYAEVSAAFDIKENTLRKKLHGLRNIAVDKVVADLAAQNLSNEISKFPESEKRIINSLAASLTEISEHLCHGAKYSAMSFHKLAQMSNLHAGKINDVNPTGPDSIDALRTHAALQKLANEAASVPLALLKANQETIDDLNRASEQPPEPKQIVFTVQDASA